MKKTRFRQMQEEVARRFPPEERQAITQQLQEEYDSLCAWGADLSPALFNHTHNNIFPVAAAFRAFLARGMDRPAAAELARDCFLTLMEEIAGSLRSLLRLPGLYRLMPRIWKTMMPRLFSEEAGFQFSFYPTDGKQVKFDMLQCPYFRLCRELDCPELAPIFCATDDVCYGHMHPKLIWNRTKTLARGGDLCDFDLYIPR